MTIDEATYRARARAHSFGVSSKKGTEYVAVTFGISPGESFEGHRVDWTGWFTDKTTARTLEALQACGWDGVDLENLGALDKEVEIVVRHEVNDRTGEVTARVAFVNEIGSNNVGKAMDKGRLRQLAQRVKSKQAAAAAPTTRVAFGGDEPDDDPAPAPTRDTASDPVNEPDDEPDAEPERTARSPGEVPF